MKSGNSPRWLSYVFMLATFLIIFFILDRFFGVHYQPDEHRLNREKNERKDTTSRIQDSDTPALERSDQDRNESIDSVALKPDTTNIQADRAEEDTNEEVIGYFEDLKKKYQADVLSDIPQNKARTDVIIRYYHRSQDGNSAYALQNLKFYIHERPVDSAFDNYQSNALFYGDNVTNEDIQLVAFTLLDEGLPIKTIKPSLFHDTWKSNAIEIGTDTTLLKLPTLTLEDIKNFSR